MGYKKRGGKVVAKKKGGAVKKMGGGMMKKDQMMGYKVGGLKEAAAKLKAQKMRRGGIKRK